MGPITSVMTLQAHFMTSMNLQNPGGESLANYVCKHGYQLKVKLFLGQFQSMLSFIYYI